MGVCGGGGGGGTSSVKRELLFCLFAKKVIKLHTYKRRSIAKYAI